MKMSEEQARKIFEGIVNKLKERGIDVAGGAFVKVDDNGEIKSMEGFGTMNQQQRNAEKPKAPTKQDYEALRNRLKEDLKVLLGELAKKMKGEVGTVPPDILERYGFKAPQPVNEMPQGAPMQEEVTNDEEECTCSNCVNYENFEQKFANKGGEFDYANVTLGKKQFKIKYHVSEHGEENMVMRDTTDDIDVDNSSNEELQLLLQEAVRERKFDKAQLILNTIQERKNKN